jgi:hypothetical protein
VLWSGWAPKEFHFSFSLIVLASRFPPTVWYRSDGNLIKHHSVCAVQCWPRFRWQDLIWIIHWDGIVTLFETTVIWLILSSWEGRGCDRTVVWCDDPAIWTASNWGLKWIQIDGAISPPHAGFTYLLAVWTWVFTMLCNSFVKLYECECYSKLMPPT